MASIGAFIAGDAVIINYLRYSMRSQIFAKSLPMTFVQGALKRLGNVEISTRAQSESMENCERVCKEALKAEGFNIGSTDFMCVTPVILKGRCCRGNPSNA
jgi:glycine C-acetyltransferase